MKIGEIRDVIQGARWLRNDYAGHTSGEFARADVGSRLTAKIELMRALVIPPRFAEDIARRNEEIEYCERVIARWQTVRA